MFIVTLRDRNNIYQDGLIFRFGQYEPAVVFAQQAIVSGHVAASIVFDEDSESILGELDQLDEDL